MILTTSNQFILPFTFWDVDVSPTKTPKGVFEIRSYTLRVGATMLYICVSGEIPMFITAGNPY